MAHRQRLVWFVGVLLGGVLAVVGILAGVFWLRMTGVLIPGAAFVVIGVMALHRRRAQDVGVRGKSRPPPDGTP